MCQHRHHAILLCLSECTAIITAVKTEAGSQQYIYNDVIADLNSNVIYYRLNVVDKNGENILSKVARINVGKETGIGLSPNPANDIVHLSVHNLTGNAIISLYDVKGRLLRSFNADIGNTLVIPLSVSSLPKGIYYIQVFVNNKVYKQKLIKE